MSVSDMPEIIEDTAGWYLLCLMSTIFFSTVLWLFTGVSTLWTLVSLFVISPLLARLTIRMVKLQYTVYLGKHLQNCFSQVLPWTSTSSAHLTIPFADTGVLWWTFYFNQYTCRCMNVQEPLFHMVLSWHVATNSHSLHLWIYWDKAMTSWA